MTPERYRQIRAIFDEAAGLAPAEQTTLVGLRCAQDAELGTAVLGLLRAAADVGARLSPDDGEVARQLFAPEPSTAVPPAEIGGYRIARLLGEGGMGSVYLAHQTSPPRPIALKLLRNITGSRTLQARFAREVRVLGRLEHPGIARIYEAGTAPTASGPVAYFAMEYVAGPHITDFAARAALSTAGRVELLAKVADAVQHAHGKGVIHRDLKPANILVADEPTTAPGDGRSSSGGPQPKVLDFGVARLIDADAERSLVSEAGQLLGTVAYMSPEQLAGDPDGIDTRADVYSMGVILYELLTGDLPHPVRGKPLAEVARSVRDTDPAPLNRPPSPESTTGARFPRDLEIIVAHALARDPDRRYATAAALADDLRRFIAGEPILARTPSAAYQLSKFAGRHRGLVLGAAATTLALVAGLVVSAIAFSQERAARRTADQSARLTAAVKGYLVEGLLMAAAPNRMGHDVKMLDVLARAADGLHERFADDPQVELEIRTQLAEVLSAVGEFQSSIAQWQLVVELSERLLGPDAPGTIEALLKQSRAAAQLKQHRAAGDLAREAFRRASRALPAGDALRIGTIAQLGRGSLQQGQLRRAEEWFAQARDLAQDNPAVPAALHLAIAAGLNESQRPQADGPNQVERGLRLVEDAETALGPDSPAAITARSNLLLAYLRAGRAADAVEIARTLPASAQRTFAPNHVARGHADRNSASIFAAVGEFAEAERLALRAWSVFAAAFPSPNAEHDGCTDQLRAIFAAWPAHTAELRDWSVAAVAYRLGHTPRQRWAAVARVHTDVLASLAAAGATMTPAELMELVWARRETVVPLGDPLRATFMANYARLAARVGGGLASRYDEAVAEAEAAAREPGSKGGALAILREAARVRAAQDAGRPLPAEPDGSPDTPDASDASPP